RGKFNRSRGWVTLDREAGDGRLEVVVETGSVDFGLDAMDEHARAPDRLDVDRHPEARYTGRLAGFADGRPTRAEGELTLRGVTRPLALEILAFQCMPHPLHGRELCGADALARFQRDDFGIDAGKAYGFDMAVTLRIQVEAVAAEYARPRPAAASARASNSSSSGALASFERDDFGIGAGKAYGFDMAVALRIQVEAVAAE